MEKLNLSEKLDKINSIIKNSENGKNNYKRIVTEKNKVLILRKNTIKTLNNNGIELNKTYISYNSTPLLYNTIEKVLTENKNIFQCIE